MFTFTVVHSRGGIVTPKGWWIFAALVALAAVVVGFLMYFLAPSFPLDDEGFRKVCGEKNECLWL